MNAHRLIQGLASARALARRRSRAVVGPIVAALILACTVPVTARPSPTATPPATPAAARVGGHLRLAQATLPRTLDPWQARDAASRAVLAQVFETLVAYEPGTLRPAPGLAERWEVSGDGRTWTFVLRAGVLFHDGTPLDAAAVVLHFDRARDRSQALRGDGDYALWSELWEPAGLPALERVEARGPLAVSFITREPFGPLLANLAHPSAAVVGPAVIERDVRGWARPGSRPAGTGPFAIASWDADAVTLERSAAYRGRDASGRALPYLERLTFLAVADEAARLQALRAGTADAALDVAVASLPAVRSAPNLQVVVRPPLSVVSLGFGGGTPFGNATVRRAVAQAVDARALSQAHFAGEALVASQLLAPGMLGYDETVVAFEPRDEEAARRTIAELTGGRGLDLELAYAAEPTPLVAQPARLAEAIAAELARVGIRASPRALDAEALRRGSRAGSLSLWIDAHQAEVADPAAFLEPLLGRSAGAVEDASSPRGVIAALLAQARASTRESDRAELYKQVSKIAREEVLRVPLVHVPAHEAATRRVQGRAPSPLGLEPLARCWLAR